MPTEDDFQARIDANPQDWAARLELADWLEARGDPRAMGYRALGMLHWYPLQGRDTYAGSWWWHQPSGNGHYTHNDLPKRWFDLLPVGPGSEWFWPTLTADGSNKKSRRDCEDAAALAFAELPEEHRAEILLLRHNP